MASLPAIAEGPTAEEQMLMAEASSVSRQTDLQTLRHDKREFIKVSLLKSTSFRSFLLHLRAPIHRQAHAFRA